MVFDDSFDIFRLFLEGSCDNGATKKPSPWQHRSRLPTPNLVQRGGRDSTRILPQLFNGHGISRAWWHLVVGQTFGTFIRLVVARCDIQTLGSPHNLWGRGSLQHARLGIIHNNHCLPAEPDGLGIDVIVAAAPMLRLPPKTGPMILRNLRSYRFDMNIISNIWFKHI